MGDEHAKVIRAKASQSGQAILNTDKPIKLEVEIEIRKAIHGLIVGWEIWNQREELLAYTLWDDDHEPPGATTRPGIYKVELYIPADTFAAGNYYASLDFGIHNQRRIVPSKSISLSLAIENTVGIGRRYPNAINAFRPSWQWRINMQDQTADIPASPE